VTGLEIQVPGNNGQVAASRRLYPEQEKCRVETEYFYRYTVGNHVPGVDQLSAGRQYFIYFRIVCGGAVSGDTVADQRQAQVIAIIIYI
jgi:hypothetical protein